MKSVITGPPQELINLVGQSVDKIKLVFQEIRIKASQEDGDTRRTGDTIYAREMDTAVQLVI